MYWGVLIQETFFLFVFSYETPANAPRNMSMLGWGATPLVTPKFDPRLPVTPANQRRPKPDEVAMSLAGSPLNVDRKTVGAFFISSTCSKYKRVNLMKYHPEQLNVHNLNLKHSSPLSL